MATNLKQLYDQGVQLGQQASKITGVPFTPQTLDSSQLSDVTPFNLAPKKTLTQADGLGAEISALSVADAKAQEIEKANEATLKTAGKDKKKITERLADFLGSRQGERALTDTAYTEAGVDTAKAKLTDVNNRINAIDVRAQNQIKKLEQAGGGLTSGFNVEVDRITRGAAIDKADLYLEKLVAQGDYDLATEIADRKVALQLEEDQNKYEQLKFAYDENKEQFNKAEQRQYEFMLDDYKNKLDQEKEDKKAINELAINASQNGAPSGLVQQALKAKTQGEVVSLIGQYLDETTVNSVTGGSGTIEDQIADLKLSAAQKTDLVDIITLESQIKSLEDLSADGTLEGIGGFGLGSIKQSAYKNLAIGNQEGADARIAIGAIKGYLAKLRGGTSFTVNEQRLLDSYTPGINETAASVASKLKGLKDFLKTKKEAIVTVGGGTVPAGTNTITPTSGKTSSGISYTVIPN